MISVVNGASTITHEICWLCLKHLPQSVIACWKMSCTKAFLCGHCKPQKNVRNPQSKPKPVPLSVAPLPICENCPAGVTVTRPEGPAEVKSLLCVTVDVVSSLPGRQTCSVRSPETSAFILRIPPAGTAAAPAAASPGPEQLPAQPGGCRAQVSTRAAFLKCLLLSVNTSGGAERARVSDDDSVRRWC